LTPAERNHVEQAGFDFRPDVVSRGIETPPPFGNLRTAAEWEEIEALTISWTGYPCIQKQIVAGAQLECLVVIFASNPSEVENYLTGSSCGGALTLENVLIVEGEYDSVWIRDYGAHTVYGEWNDERVLVDWLYNRPRPNDDAIPDLLAETLDIPLYSTTAAPTDLMNTGGNWMVDGFGTAFASELILDENDGGSSWWTDYPDHTESEIDAIVSAFHGVDTYIKMPTLPFDGIHHIDMHMKLLDEERILVAEYPEGVADGPQIEANIEYVLANYSTRWGTPFEVIRIPSPPELGWGGGYPDEGGWYETYTNSVFVNNTVLLPTYYEAYDTTAIRIYEEALPGYNIIGIDCDGNEPIIAASGAIHCITKSVGVEDPLIISHLPLNDTEDTVNDYPVVAEVSHRSGLSSVDLVYTTDAPGASATWTTIPMAPSGSDDFTATLPAAAAGTTYHYYISAEAISGKQGNRPMPAPEGFWSFDILTEVNGIAEWRSETAAAFQPVFPNPASAITCIPVAIERAFTGSIVAVDVLGREISTIARGEFTPGTQKFFFHASGFPAGPVILQLRKEGVVMDSQTVIIQD
jgi:agmatine/peptidylarginine deiminase